MDPISFVRSVPPFDRLEEVDFDSIKTDLETVFFPSGTTVAEESGSRLEHLYLIRKGGVSIRLTGEPDRLLEEGETFGLPAERGSDRAPAAIVAATDVLAFRIPSAVFDELLLKSDEFAAFFTKRLPERLRSLTELQLSSLSGDMAAPVRTLVSRPLVAVVRGTPIGEVARVMRDERVSSVVIDADPAGIVTDRDLRNRVLAERLNSQTPVEEIMSSPLRTVDAASPAFGALILMLEWRIHHAAVVEDGRVVGIVTDGDLLRHQSKSPIYLLRWIDRIEDFDNLSGYSTEIAGMAEVLFGAGLDPLRIALVIASLNDAVTRRLLRVAEEKLGPAPSPFGWLVFGSEGRLEQVLLTDQDNALAFADGGPEVDHYFAELARIVVEGLLSAGFPPCRANCVATRLRYPIDVWHDMLLSGVERPNRESIMDASVLFDFRKVAGGLDTSRLESAVLNSAAQPAFMQKLARAVVRSKPPLTTFARKPGAIDLKRTALAPIVGMARLYGLAAGIRGPSTVERLRQAASTGVLPNPQAEMLIEAFRFLLTLRLRIQLDAFKRGEELTNIVEVGDLSAVEQRHLKETFAEIRSVLHKTSRRWHTSSVH